MFVYIVWQLRISVSLSPSTWVTRLSPDPCPCPEPTQSTKLDKRSSTWSPSSHLCHALVQLERLMKTPLEAKWRPLIDTQSANSLKTSDNSHTGETEWFHKIIINMGWWCDEREEFINNSLYISREINNQMEAIEMNSYQFYLFNPSINHAYFSNYLNKTG